MYIFLPISASAHLKLKKSLTREKKENEWNNVGAGKQASASPIKRAQDTWTVFMLEK